TELTRKVPEVSVRLPPVVPPPEKLNTGCRTWLSEVAMTPSLTPDAVVPGPGETPVIAPVVVSKVSTWLPDVRPAVMLGFGLPAAAEAETIEAAHDWVVPTTPRLVNFTWTLNLSPLLS